MRVNVTKTKMIIRSENPGKVKEKIQFFCRAFRKGVGSNSILCQLYRCWLQTICSGVKHVQISKQTLRKTEKFCYLGETAVARGSAVDSVITRIRVR